MSNNHTNLKTTIAELGYLIIAETEKAVKVHGITKNQIEFNLWIPKTAENAEAELIKKMNEIRSKNQRMIIERETEKAVKVRFLTTWVWVPKSVFEVLPYLTKSVEDFIISKAYKEINMELFEKESEKAVMKNGQWIPKSQILYGKYIPKWLYDKIYGSDK